MTSGTFESLCDPVLIAVGVPHGFGRKGSQVPERTVFTKQVHGVGVWQTGSSLEPASAEADALLSCEPGHSVGIVTADCVPILAAAEDASAVVAIHAGWRGMAAGVIEAGVRALEAQASTRPWVAAVGPAARGCCYEVDEPVRAGLAGRYSTLLEGVLEPRRSGRYQLDLSSLAVRILGSLGVDPTKIGVTHRVCTICDPDRFESYRRDGSAAGQLKHFITRPAVRSEQG